MAQCKTEFKKEKILREMIEIERKFLLLNDSFKENISTQNRITQGYLNTDPERTVRVRIKKNKGFITIKGASNKTGASRFEWEKEIPFDEAQQLIQLCEKGVIDKTRYEVKSDKHVFEIDIFHGDNEGLILAEIELESENESFKKPNWLGEEVTGDPRYYNSFLSKTPFTKW
jgi:adenylate cyclase